MSITGTDVIRLVGLGGVGRHGVLPEERRDGQLFKVDLLMHVDTRAAAAGDDLAQTVNYAEVASDVVGLIEGEPVNLVETLAARIADAVLARSAVQGVEVTVHKPEAPVGVPFDDVQVTIVRGAEQAPPVPAAAPAPVAAEPVVAAPAVAAPVVEPEPDEGVPAVAEAEPEPQEPPTDLDAEPAEPVEVVLGLGGNVGDVRATLRQAIDDLAAAEVLEVIAVAPLAKTAAVLQPDAVSQPDYLNTVVVARTGASPRALLALAQQVEAAHGRVREQRWGERTLDVDIITYGSISSPDPDLSLPHPRANERAFVLVPWAHLDPDAFLPGLGGGPVAVLADTAPDREGVRWLALDWYEQRAPRPAAPVAASAAEDRDPEPEVEDVSTSRVDTGSAAAAVAAEVAPESHSPYARPAAPEPAPEPVPDPQPAPVPQPQPEPLPESDPVPAAAPEPAPAAEPDPEPDPEPEPDPDPDPTPASQVEPDARHVPASEARFAPPVAPAPVPPAAPAPEPAPHPEPEAAPRVTAAPEPQPAPQPEQAAPPVAPAPEPQPSAPWEQPEQQEPSPTRIRPRWEPIRREDSEE
ncbi:2-amino-4-hydroxy-6-hydroxymethyldihydropteridine diphosphokinase [Pseudactinotalea sp.]|uniref:2-amino-4-hydroxy-6- hydroxymethyldihydropteridine diphosphokinase n=1 Tax=Pseudactinotalea sp. TaxID=1926260 RepID=UPI003B3BA544